MGVSLASSVEYINVQCTPHKEKKKRKKRRKKKKKKKEERERKRGKEYVLSFELCCSKLNTMVTLEDHHYEKVKRRTERLFFLFY